MTVKIELFVFYLVYSSEGALVLAQILEAMMLVTFGLSWPINAYKNYTAATAAGTSWQFIGLITVGYIVGIMAKFVSGQVNWVLVVYFLNLVCLSVNWAVYFRNVRLDRARIDEAEHTATVSTGGLEHVVVASDGSHGSLKAATFAAQVLDLHHADTVQVLAVAADGSQAARKHAQSAIDETSKILLDRGITCTGDVRVGVPAAEIVDATVREDAGIVVMGCRGLSGLKEAVLGSVSREVADNVACPVLIIK